MENISHIEENYNMFISNMGKWLPEGIIPVDITLLSRFNLLYSFTNQEQGTSITSNFKVFETPEKITLLSPQFVIWIIPQRHDLMPITHVLIAISRENSLHLELAFSASGVYNSSRLVLRVLEKMLEEINDTEEQLYKIAKASN
jgi:hypothetical protein